MACLILRRAFSSNVESEIKRLTAEIRRMKRKMGFPVARPVSGAAVHAQRQAKLTASAPGLGSSLGRPTVREIYKVYKLACEFYSLSTEVRGLLRKPTRLGPP